uniref:Uncharacterized protein n=1 Tax=viral metagenome TaxID=1070528 RepID=A0A6C0E1S7_9ZZZZ
MSKESSLTAPEDRDKENRWRPEQSQPPLSNEETVEAMKELNITSFVDKFPKVDRTFADPPVNMQNYGLFSFIPAKGSSPNENGVYGYAKIRGSYQSELEASQRAEYLIRNVDSYHKIYHTYVGRPFPLTESSSYSADVSEVDIKKDMSKNISHSIKDKKEDELKEIREIQQREKNLIEESKREEVDPYDEYITQRVKKAQLVFTYLEHQKKMAEVKEIIIKTRKVIAEMDETHPTFNESYYEKYMQARKDAGITEDIKEAQDNFIKFLVEDVDLGF